MRFFRTIHTGHAWLALSMLAQYIWCILLPLVGRAGSDTAHARENFMTVCAVQVIALAFTVLWFRSSWERKCSPLILGAVQLGLLVLLLLNAFAA